MNVARLLSAAVATKKRKTNIWSRARAPPRSIYAELNSDFLFRFLGLKNVRPESLSRVLLVARGVVRNSVRRSRRHRGPRAPRFNVYIFNFFFAPNEGTKTTATATRLPQPVRGSYVIYFLFFRPICSLYPRVISRTIYALLIGRIFTRIISSSGKYRNK